LDVTDATRTPDEGAESLEREDGHFTSRYDYKSRRWLRIPPTPRRLCYGQGVFRRTKERKRGLG